MIINVTTSSFGVSSQQNIPMLIKSEVVPCQTKDVNFLLIFLMDPKHSSLASIGLKNLCHGRVINVIILISPSQIKFIIHLFISHGKLVVH